MKRSTGESTLRIEYRPLADLLALRWVENPHDHDLGLIHQSIDEHGFNDPVTLGRVGKQEMLVEGHGRLECLAQKMNAGDRAPARIKAKFKGRYQVDWLVPVNIGVECPTLQKAKKYALQHNRLTEMGGYHDDKLLEALKEQRLDLDGIGWDEADIDALMHNQTEHLAEDASAKLGGFQYKIIISCKNEKHQGILIKRLEKEGLICQPLIS